MKKHYICATYTFMANESTKYYVGFEESVGDENASNLLYRNIYVYDYKENEECLKLPFYFMLGKHDYVWDSNGERKILKVYEGTANLLWNEAENDIQSNNGLKEFSFEEWKSRYEARKEELEKKANERMKENTLYGRPISGGIVDAIYNGCKESKDEPTQSNGTKSSSVDKTIKRIVIAFIAIALVVFILLTIKDPTHRLRLLYFFEHLF